MLLRSLRIALYVQLLLGLILFFGPGAGFNLPPRLGDFHALIGIVVVVLALIGLRPMPAVPMTGIRIVAWLAPLVPLLIGLGFMSNAIPKGSLVPVHMLLGIIVLGLVEMAAGQERRSLRRGPRISI